MSATGTLARVGRALRDPRKIVKFLEYRVRLLEVRKVTKNGELFHEYRGELYPDYLNHGNAASYTLERAQRFCEGRGIDVGANVWPFPGATPILDEPEQSAYKLDRFEDGSLDYVFSSHCLEHLEQWQDALALWIRKLRAGGVLFLYLPHESMKLWNPGAPWVLDGHKWQPRHQVLVPFLEERGMEVLDFEKGRDEYWSFHIVSRKRSDSTTP